jgi:hypothetical protein
MGSGGKINVVGVEEEEAEEEEECEEGEEEEECEEGEEEELEDDMIIGSEDNFW